MRRHRSWKCPSGGRSSRRMRPRTEWSWRGLAERSAPARHSVAGRPKRPRPERWYIHARSRRPAWNLRSLPPPRGGNLPVPPSEPPLKACCSSARLRQSAGRVTSRRSKTLRNPCARKRFRRGSSCRGGCPVACSSAADRHWTTTALDSCRRPYRLLVGWALA